MKNPYVIAETAYSFEGSKQYLLDSINNVPDEVNAIKFHLLFDMDEYMVGHYTVLRDLLKKWLLPAEEIGSTRLNSSHPTTSRMPSSA